MQYDAGGLFQARGLVRFYRFTPPLDGPDCILVYVCLSVCVLVILNARYVQLKIYNI